jgi:hypothetical protein
MPGVAAPKPMKLDEPPPGVLSIDDGSGVFAGGGVDGGFMALPRPPFLPGLAGDGDVAKNMSRSASSLRVAAVFAKGLLRRRAERATSGLGVLGIMRGGEERIWRELAAAKE